jgi:diaminohydroxyphosphoribosylaminopyrimidine deaminase/5-amino-6-(5-phosphoribosylamino)uracil reductase
MREAGSRASNATLYVTLEPCTHSGKRPPCVDAILSSGLRRVVIACHDPSADAGGGAEVLRSSGIEVEVGVYGAAAKRLNAAFMWRRLTGTPFASLKLAVSLDAKIGAEGERSTVSGQTALEYVHGLRAAHDAILIGRRTAEIDDPLLTPRGDIQPRRPPIRIVLDPSLRLGPDSRLAQTIDAGPVWVIADVATADDPDRRRPLQETGVEVLGIKRRDDDHFDAEELWNLLAERGVDSILVEGGGRTAAGLLRQRRVQRMHLILAPLFFGESGVPAFPGVESDEDGWTPVAQEALGNDTHLVLEHMMLDAALGRI